MFSSSLITSFEKLNRPTNLSSLWRHTSYGSSWLALFLYCFYDRWKWV